MVMRIMKTEYKFSYGSIFKLIFSQVMLCIYNFFAFLIVAIPVALLYGEIESIFRENYVLMKIITILMTIFIIVYALILCVFFFLPKKAIIKRDFVIIKRYMLNFGYILRGFNDEIYIKEIVECKKYDGEKYCLDRSGPYAVFFFDWDSLVEIRTIDNKCYLVPLKNSDDFIEEINKKREKLQNNKTDDSSIF